MHKRTVLFCFILLSWTHCGRTDTTFPSSISEIVEKGLYKKAELPFPEDFMFFKPFVDLVRSNMGRILGVRGCSVRQPVLKKQTLN